jgi:hypothetical protein
MLGNGKWDCRLYHVVSVWLNLEETQVSQGVSHCVTWVIASKHPRNVPLLPCSQNSNNRHLKAISPCFVSLIENPLRRYVAFREQIRAFIGGQRFANTNTSSFKNRHLKQKYKNQSTYDKNNQGYIWLFLM